MNQIIHQLKTSRRVLVASHVNPDGDAVGALLAMGMTLDRLGKRVTWFNPSPIPAVYRFLPSVHRIVERVPQLAAHDTAVVLDCSSLRRLGAIWERVERLALVVNIDHHVTNNGFGHLQYIDTGACATAELVYYLAHRLGVTVTRDMATAIYTGILTDTGSFRFANTTGRTFAICQQMVALGVDPYEVAQHVYGTYSLERIKLLNMALDSIEISPNGKLSLMSLTADMLRQTGTAPEDADGMINYARRIQDVKVAALIMDVGNGDAQDAASPRLQVSLRSDGSVDVAAIATTYGGGGHSSAAGFCVDASLPTLKHQLFDLAEGM